MDELKIETDITKKLTEPELVKAVMELQTDLTKTLNSHTALLAACEMVSNSIFRNDDDEWELSRPAELLKVIADEAIAGAKE